LKTEKLNRNRAKRIPSRPGVLKTPQQGRIHTRRPYLLFSLFACDKAADTLPPELRNLVQKHLDHCEICSAILDSTRNILILTADDLVFELPVGFSERLHARLDQEMTG
jgi:hypothetical protein